MKKTFTRIQMAIVSVCFALFFFGMAATSSAGTYYIAPASGQPAGTVAGANLSTRDGSITEPWLTMGYASTRIGAGDILYVRGGTYYESNSTWSASGTSGSRILVRNYQSEVPIFDGQNGSARLFIATATDYTTWEGLTIQNYLVVSTGAIWFGYSGSGTNYSVGNTINKCTFKNIGSSTNPQQNHAVYVSWGVTDITISNNTFINLSGGAVHCYHTPGVQRAEIFNNKVFNALWAVILADGATDVHIYNNLIVDCGQTNNGGIELNYGGGGNTNTIVRNNIFHSNFLALNTGANTHNATISDNLFYNNTNNGTLGTNYETGNPNFVNFQLNGTGDYHLTATSTSAINTGITTGAPTTDFDGVTRTGNPDIGPYEYVSSCGFVAVPGTPGSPTAAAVGGTSSQIQLTWSNVSNEEDYRIERSSTSATAGFSEIATVAADVTSYTSTGLTASTQYWYRIRARNCFGYSAYSTPVVSATTCPPTAPSTPTAPGATANSSSQITFTWTDNSNYETNYELERSTTSATAGFSVIATLPAYTGTGVRTYVNTGLSGSTTYWYRVRGWNCFGYSAYTAVVSATTPTSCAFAVVPGTPGSTTATAVGGTSSQIQLTWSNVSNEESYRIERSSTSATAGFSEIDTVAANVTSYTSTGLTASTTYWYRIRARNCFGNSPYSSPVVSATTCPPTAPSTPTALATTAASGYYASSEINLSWTDNSGYESAYFVERATASGGPYTVVATLAPFTGTAPGPASYTDWGLSPGITYYYRVRATNCFGYSAYTAVVSRATAACTTPTASSTPSAPSATANSSSQITLNWTDNSNYEATYLVERSSVSGTSGFALVATLAPFKGAAPGPASYVNTGLTASTQYWYRIRAWNCFGYSVYTAVVTATTASGFMSASSSAISSDADASEPVSKEISVYPNPSVTSFTLSIPSDVIIKGGMMKIYDKYGKEVKAVSISSNITTIERGSLQSGIYYFNIMNNNERIYNGKLMISNE